MKTLATTPACCSSVAAHNQSLVSCASLTRVPTLVIVNKQDKPLKLFIAKDKLRQLKPTPRVLLHPVVSPILGAKRDFK